MHLNARKEKFSQAYVSALCARVGCAIASWDVDDDSVDLTLKKTGASGVIPSPMLDVQLKATARPQTATSGIAFPLRTKNFADLRQPSHYPRILVVVTVPSDDVEDWLEQLDEQRLSLMSCGYWASLPHLDLPDNASSVTVPLQRVFNADSLDELMERISHQKDLVGDDV